MTKKRETFADKLRSRMYGKSTWWSLWGQELEIWSDGYKGIDPSDPGYVSVPEWLGIDVEDYQEVETPRDLEKLCKRICDETPTADDAPDLRREFEEFQEFITERFNRLKVKEAQDKKHIDDLEGRVKELETEVESHEEVLGTKNASDEANDEEFEVIKQRFDAIEKLIHRHKSDIEAALAKEIGEVFKAFHELDLRLSQCEGDIETFEKKRPTTEAPAPVKTPDFLFCQGCDARAINQGGVMVCKCCELPRKPPGNVTQQEDLGTKWYLQRALLNHALAHPHLTKIVATLTTDGRSECKIDIEETNQPAKPKKKSEAPPPSPRD